MLFKINFGGKSLNFLFDTILSLSANITENIKVYSALNRIDRREKASERKPIYDAIFVFIGLQHNFPLSKVRFLVGDEFLCNIKAVKIQEKSFFR